MERRPGRPGVPGRPARNNEWLVKSVRLSGVDGLRTLIADYIPAASTPTMRNVLVDLPFTFSIHGLMSFA